MLGIALATATPALAEIHWHPDLPSARAAATASNKPVLAIFTATWSSDGSRLTSETLASPEVEAVVMACFEPVLLDVDAHPAITKRMNVERVPVALVLGVRGGRLASFDCPEAPSAFVAAAARAAQAAAAAGGASASDMPEQMPHSSAIATDDSASSAAAPPVGGSISVVTSKVEQLSGFVSGVEGDPAALQQQGRPSIDPAPTPAPPATPWLGSAPQPAAPHPAAMQQPLPQPVVPQQPAPQQPALRQTELQAAAPQPSPPQQPSTVLEPPASSAVVSDLPEQPATKSAWDSFAAAFQKPFGMFSKPTAKPAEPPTMPPAKPSSAALLTAALPPKPEQPQQAEQPVADAYGSMPLGLEGYCPVTLAERGVWSEGRAQWGVRHRGRTYLFAGPEQQQAFLANPDRYAPALSGDDPVLAVDQGRSLPGRRTYGVTYQSRMYLFASPENRAAFTANPERYTTRVMLAERPAAAEGTRRF
ncbi:MAG: thioredoxin family protein [Pirellulales bacterium]